MRFWGSKASFETWVSGLLFTIFKENFFLGISHSELLSNYTQCLLIPPSSLICEVMLSIVDQQIVCLYHWRNEYNEYRLQSSSTEKSSYVLMAKSVFSESTFSKWIASYTHTSEENNVAPLISFTNVSQSCPK